MIRIQLLANDKEGHQIQEDGPICAIYKEGLFNDASALNALGNVDNLNANVQMPESELMAFNRASQEHIHVEEKYLQLAGSTTNMVQHHLAMRKETLERVRMNGGLAPLGEGQCVRGCVRTWVGTYVLSLSGGDGARTSCAPPGVPALGRRLSARSMPDGEITSAPRPPEKKY